MKHHILLIFLIILLPLTLSLTGCHNNEAERHDPRLDQLEARVSDNPDSVRIVLENLDTAELTTDFDRSRHAMLLMMAKDKCYLPLQPDSALNKATEYFSRTKDLLNETKARYYAGLAERHVGNYQQAIWETLHAIDCAHEAADTFWMGRVHNLAYEIYMNTYDCRNAAIEADKAAVYFKRAGALRFHHYAIFFKARALNYPVNEDGSPIGGGMALLDSLKNEAILVKDSALVATCLQNLAFYDFKAKKYELAMARTDSISIFSNNPSFLYHLLPDIISLKISQGLSPTASFRTYEAQLKTRNDTLSFLNTKRKYAVATQNWKQAYLISDTLQKYYDIIMAEKSFNSIDEIKDRYSKALIEEKQKENSHLKSTRSMLAYIALGVLASLLILLILIRFQSKNKERSTMGKLLEIASENQDLKMQMKSQDTLISENHTLKDRLDASLQDKNSIETENRILKSEAQEKLKEQNRILTLNENLKSKAMDYEKLLAENTHLKQQLQLKDAEWQQKNKDEIMKTEKLYQEHLSLLGNRIDTLCHLAMQYYGDKENKAFKNDIYHRVLDELRELKSEKFLNNLQLKINSIHNNILDRLSAQLPEIIKGNIRWIALTIGGVQPRTISFLLDMNIQTLYSKRLRFRSYIEKSNAPDKMEFLRYFPKGRG